MTQKAAILGDHNILEAPEPLGINKHIESIQNILIPEKNNSMIIDNINRQINHHSSHQSDLHDT